MLLFPSRCPPGNTYYVLKSYVNSCRLQKKSDLSFQIALHVASTYPGAQFYIGQWCVVDSPIISHRRTHQAVPKSKFRAGALLYRRRSPFQAPTSQLTRGSQWVFPKPQFPIAYASWRTCRSIFTTTSRATPPQVVPSGLGDSRLDEKGLYFLLYHFLWGITTSEFTKANI